jgi:hypothetical protein
MRILPVSPRILPIMSDGSAGVPRESILGSEFLGRTHRDTGFRDRAVLSRKCWSRAYRPRPGIGRSAGFFCIDAIRRLNIDVTRRLNRECAQLPRDDLEHLFGHCAPPAPFGSGSRVGSCSMTQACCRRGGTRPEDPRRATSRSTDLKLWTARPRIDVLKDQLQPARAIEIPAAEPDVG